MREGMIDEGLLLGFWRRGRLRSMWRGWGGRRGDVCSWVGALVECMGVVFDIVGDEARSM